MTFKKILCPTDFSSGSQLALRTAARVAASSGAELVVAHVWQTPPFSFGGGDPFPAEVIDRMVKDKERQLTAALGDAAALGARASSRFLTGAPWDQIVETLRGDAAFDLVVIGTHGRTGIARMLLGSVAEKVVRHAPCATLVARGRGDATSFSHVLCPIDFSDLSRHAVEQAATLVAPSGTITLLHVVDLPAGYGGEPTVSGLLEHVVQDVQQRSIHWLEQWASDLKSKGAVAVTTEVRLGSPSMQTLAVLDHDPTYDLVVMGSHGQTGIRRALLGSVAERVVRHAPCPVFVARARPA